MEKISISGGKPLFGKIRVSGSKNSSLPILSCSLLTDKKLTIKGVPKLTDTFFFLELLSSLGVNISNINKSLKEAYRVLKPGGRFLCLEFSKIQNIYFNNLYKKYSKLIPHIGKIVVGEKEPYDYLIESIENFINQDELIELMQKNYFIKCEYRNLSGGMVAIHSGWKI